jgi:hypothetical protein
MPISKTKCALGWAKYTDPDCRHWKYTGDIYPCERHVGSMFDREDIEQCAHISEDRYNLEEEKPLPDMCEFCQEEEAQKPGDMDDAKAGASRA